jgi:hypothetical protein
MIHDSWNLKDAEANYGPEFVDDPQSVLYIQTNFIETE